MARLFQSGFELNSLTAGVEFDVVNGSPSLSTTTVRSGTYALHCTSSSGVRMDVEQQFASVAGNGPYYFRFYINLVTSPSIVMALCRFTNTAFGATQANIKMNTTGGLQLLVNGVQIGTDSADLSTNIWHLIELKFDRSPAAGSQVAELKIDGSIVATSSSLTITSPIIGWAIGANGNSELQTTADFYLDDLAINDSTGSFQNSYAGSGKIIHLQPNATGDSNVFTTQTGGTAGASNNYTRVNEVSPDDVTTFNGDNTLNDEDLFKCIGSGIGAKDIVNVVAIGVRLRNNVADATTAIKIEVEKTGLGTKAQSSAIIPNSVTWKTNAIASPLTYPIITYQDPDSANWTKTTLDSIQIGYKLTAGGVNRIDVSTIWASIDFTPAILSGYKTLLGAGQI